METLTLISLIIARDYMLPSAVVVGIIALFTGMTFLAFVLLTLLGTFIAAFLVILYGALATALYCNKKRRTDRGAN